MIVEPKVWGEILQFLTSQSPVFWGALGSFFGWAPISLQARPKPISLQSSLNNSTPEKSVRYVIHGKFPCMSCVIRATHMLQKTNPGIRIPWFIRAGYKNVLPGFSWTCFCWRFVTDCTGTKTTMKPPFWENSFGTLSKALPSTTATLHCLGGFEATNGQAMPSCTAAGAGKDCLTVCVEDGFSFGKAGFGECT